MQNVLVPIFIVGIITLGIYRVFELFVRRKERMSIIEKFQNNVDISAFANKLNLPFFGETKVKMSSSSWPLRASLLLIGIGLGLLVAFFLESAMTNSMHPVFSSYEYQVQRNIRDSVGLIYIAAVSLFGGLGLLVAYLIEQKNERKHKE